MLYTGKGQIVEFGFEVVPADGADLAVGANQVFPVVDGFRKADILEMVHIVDLPVILNLFERIAVALSLAIHQRKIELQRSRCNKITRCR